MIEGTTLKIGTCFGHFINNAHDRAVKKSKVTPFRLYDCRHTFATRPVESGIDLVTLAAMLGHSKINMVLRYAHPHKRTRRGRWTKWNDTSTNRRLLMLSAQCSTNQHKRFLSQAEMSRQGSASLHYSLHDSTW
ncbi:tyrosine-type recombinase/integrase [Granulicella sp. S190]|uniref:tyrosine-type recombinase/integrase n=1 Tax=Granulicella sp. S190 TaxID=1747226 RepID=UPI00131D84F4